MDILSSWFTPQGVIALGVIFNVYLVLSTKKDMRKLEQNTNSKMDKLLQAKDDLAVAQVGQAIAEGKEAGRIAEVERAKDG